MELRPGLADPLFVCELALEMKMPVGELGQRMSLHELTVVWPAFFDYRRRAAAREAEKSRGR
ncbi:MAG TPA: hypothetical protein VK595_17975 [Vicinamibacterales bacterium]|nr:hypothetical protein [Vicinamibacterales bacterium]